VYIPGGYKGETVHVRSYAVAPGDALTDKWTISDFENGRYHLRVYGPNGFYREFTGTENDPLFHVDAVYEMKGNIPTGKLSLQFNILAKQSQVVSIIDNAYKSPLRILRVSATGSAKEMVRITLDTQKSFGWYDVSIRIKGNSSFDRRYAGRIETGKPSKTDPFMGRII
jgi:phospholipase C